MSARQPGRRQLPFRAQLAGLFVIMALLIGGIIAGFVTYQQQQLLETNVKRQAEVIAHLAAQDIARMVLLDDPDVAADIARRLSSIPEILEARVEDLQGRPLLHLPPRQSPDGRAVRIALPVEEEGVPLGRVELRFASPQLDAAQRRAQRLFYLVVGGTMLLGLLFGLYLDRSYIARLAELSRTIREAASHEDYGLRLRVDGRDEIGVARAQLNHLLERVARHTDTLRYQAQHDTLTGLYNRSRLLSELETLLQQPAHDGYHAVCYMDLDGFKVVNDTCGHLAGDALLKQLGECLLDYVAERPACRVGRLGGDEFLLSIADRPAQEIAQSLTELQRRVRTLRFQFMERDFPVSLSIGCILLKAEAASVTDIIAAADGACHQAKQTQKGGLVTLRMDDPRAREHQQRLDWVSRLHAALEQGLFRLYLQPIVPAVSGTDNGRHYELLLRLQEGGETIPPGDFIPVAERFGISPRLDLWVIEAVFSYLCEHRDFFERLDLISINLSGLTLNAPDSRQAIDLLLKAFPLAPEKLCFEITETAVISEMAQAEAFIDHFRTRGVRFALDDFGSGMASFGYLRHLDVDILKIDGSFIRRLAEDPILEEMTRAMVRIGHITGKRIVAEQVEDERTARLLTEMGVNYLQGYYFGRPVAIDEVVRKWQRERPVTRIG